MAANLNVFSTYGLSRWDAIQSILLYYVCHCCQKKAFFKTKNLIYYQFDRRRFLTIWIIIQRIVSCDLPLKQYDLVGTQ